MKIFNWNCGGAFRKKLEKVFDSNSDIYIIQECESPKKLDNELLKDFIIHWKGKNQNKGLAIIHKKNISGIQIDFNENYRNRQLKWFLPIIINNNFTLLAVWTHKADAKAFAYIGQFYWYLKYNKDKLIQPIIVGDFNSNSIWDSWDIWWNHTDIVNELEEMNIYSLYHTIFKETQGKESYKTFFHRKNIEKGYHIDYIFAEKKYINKTKNFQLGKLKDWFELSDHIPLVWEFDLKK